MRVTSKGQVTIPRDLRELAGIKPNSEVLFAMEGGKLTIVPKDGRREREDKARLEDFLDGLKRLEGTGDQGIDADKLMEMTRDR
ncbi:MAG TPA: AbrB/MazE/SpoVT family DNA-binding domain-containing protein [Pararhizobium sp.]|uniref:AbrB/MazE/SpoVT family DNA-binding domain-containing protein n=1 Tax=Pararhizobium sp. TaxID=1977563 RepID=UPI002BFBF08F|nr:AbrB/MazE/SpoVT family DNA-binding domain-containing protein [Pararhizobium sp.]HTO33699.1 AbrB/MazE/SpoVT family DNA-binding domain-containing protein [Pararhizobium sp.]